MKLYIKNMVCNRCIIVVRDVMKNLNIDYKDVTLGEVNLNKPLTPTELHNIDEALQSLGFELIEDRNSRIIEQIKAIIIDIIQKVTRDTLRNPLVTY